MVAGTQACEATLRACRLRSSTGFVYFKNKTVNYNMQTPIGASRATSIELSVNDELVFIVYRIGIMRFTRAPRYVQRHGSCSRLRYQRSYPAESRFAAGDNK